MHRDFQKVLTHWKQHPLRMPLIVRGARQVGKTYTIQIFGKENFKNVVTLNFEVSPAYKTCFETMDLRVILRSIELIERQKIIPGETLLFLDEIQQCPKALQSLRYFKENLPELHVIAAGSLLEFVIQEENFSFPVGRIQFVRLYPLSFGEFLDAHGDHTLRKELDSFHIKSPPPLAIHECLQQRIREYFIIGGMPAVLTAYLKTNSFLEAKLFQKAIWDAYENDFGKYAPQTQHRHLRKIFQEVPRLIGDHVKYSKIDPDLPNPSREMKRALELLHLAGLLHPISATSGGAIPLLANAKENIFKLLFLDIGLVQQVMNIDPNYPGLMSGPLAEQFVGQELIANYDPFLENRLFFWSREKGSAEVDYLTVYKDRVLPIEVKAGKSGKLKSLHLFMQEKNSPFGIKISEEPLQVEGEILSIPFYLIAHLPRLIQEMSDN